MSEADASTDAGAPTARIETPVSFRAFLLLAVPSSLLGAIAAAIGDASILVIAVLLALPALWFVLAGACAWAWARRRPHTALRMATVGLGLLAPLQIGLPAHPWDVPDSPTTFLDDCPAPATLPDHLTLVTWNTQRAEVDQVDGVAAQLDGVDIVLLQEVDTAFAASLAEALDGEAVHVGQNWRPTDAQPLGNPVAKGPAIVVPRGRFARCGDQFAQMFTLPGIAERTTRAVLARPEAGPPVLVVHHDRPRHLDEIAAWPEQLRAVSGRVASLARAAGDAVIVAGDTNTSERFHRFHATIRSVGLHAAPTRRTWPADLRGRTIPPVLALDRVYLGPAWRAVSVEPVRFGPSDHRGLRVEFERAR